MKQAWLRFYEELNDYLPDDKKKRPWACRFEGEVSIAILVSATGVPIGEVDLILRNGESANPSNAVRDDDRISIYPVFESLDIKNVTRVRVEPLRRPCFVAGPGLERLASHLCNLGFDVRYGSGLSVQDLINVAETEKRIFLCRAGCPAPLVSRAYCVRGRNPRRQVEEVFARLDLHRLSTSSRPHPCFSSKRTGSKLP
jgi:hypothetical protein